MNSILFTFTAVRGTSYLHKEAKGFRPEDKDQLDGEIAWFTASMEDNDTLGEQFIARQKLRYANNPDAYAIRIKGEYRELAGRRIFGDAIPKIHVRPPIKSVWFRNRGLPTKVLPVEVPRIDLWAMPMKYHTYVIGSDVADGLSDGDFSTAHVICLETSEVVARLQCKIMPGPFATQLAFLGWFYNTAKINWEMNYEGANIYDRLSLMRYPNMAMRESFSGRVEDTLKMYGFRTSDGNAKHAIIGELREALCDGRLRLKDELTLNELKEFGYIRKDPGRGHLRGIAALVGHDDLVMSLAIAWYTTRQVTPSRLIDRGDDNFGDRLEKETLERMRSEERLRRRAFSV